MSQVRVDFDALCKAYESGDWRTRYYFDARTGTVVRVAEETRRALQEIYDAVGESEATPLLGSAELAEAHAVEMDDERYWKVPEQSAAELQALREKFAETADPALQRLLWQALDMGDFSAFERFLILEPADNWKWHAFRAAHERETLIEWLAGRGMMPDASDSPE